MFVVGTYRFRKTSVFGVVLDSRAHVRSHVGGGGKGKTERALMSLELTLGNAFESTGFICIKLRTRFRIRSP